ncbi:MAG: chemotaxis protein CheB, partial [Dokdonella sp.]
LRDVSDQFGEDCIAVVLSGVASDAAEGCRYVAERGGHVCAQVPASCVSSGMVEQVQQTGVVSFLGTPTELAAHLLLDRR